MARGNKPVDFAVFYSRFKVQGVLQTDTALRIGSGRDSDPTGHDLPVLKDLRGRPFIPGSSFKGAFRAHLERLLRGIDETLACISTPRPREAKAQKGCLTQGDVDRLKAAHQNDPDELSAQIWRNSCWTCSLMGAPWLASKLLVRDLIVDPDTWFDRYLIRDGVAIDRDTETAAEGMKYDFEAVPAGTEFQFELVVDNATEAELGLTLLGLREFEEGRVTLGGAASRGLGMVRLALAWNQSEWLTAQDLPDYFARKNPLALHRLADKKNRETYWQYFLQAITQGKGATTNA